MDFQEEIDLSNVTHHEKYERLNSNLWQRSKVDEHGRLTLPKDLRWKLGINGQSAVILWISAKRGKQDNIFNIEVGLKK